MKGEAIKKVKKLIKILAFLLVLLVVAVVPSSSLEEQHLKTNTHSSSSTHNLISPELSSEIKLHGFVLWASMGLLMPMGILIIRISNTEQFGGRRRRRRRRLLRVMFYLHSTLQIVSVVVATGGAVMSIKNFDNSFNNGHQRIGVALYGLIWVQAFIGLLRPQRGSRGRSIWYFVHWVMGTTVSLLGIINIYTGLQAYHKRTSKTVRLWEIAFTGQLCVIGFLYLFQEKWEYMKQQQQQQQQGVILLSGEPIRPTDQEDISPRDNHKPQQQHFTQQPSPQIK